MTVPKGVKMPQDHKTAVQDEAEGTPTVTIESNGVMLTFPSDFDDWPVETVLAFEEGKVATAIRAAAGPEQWAALMAKAPVKRDLQEIFERLGEALGLGTSGN